MQIMNARNEQDGEYLKTNRKPRYAWFFVIDDV